MSNPQSRQDLIPHNDQINSGATCMCLVPIVVGAIGHRDIPTHDIEKLETAIRSQLMKLADAHPSSPLMLITCIAEGADRLVAKVALQLGWSLGVILPATEKIYELDFQSEESKREFQSLLNLARWIERLEAKPDGTCDYLGAGIRLLQQSQVVIALWDGIENGLAGGTGDIVKQCLNCIPKSGRSIPEVTLPDARPVFHIITRRSSSLNTIRDDLVGSIHLLAPTPGGIASTGELERWMDVERRIDQFNYDSRLFCKKQPNEIVSSLSYLDESKPTSTSDRQHIDSIASLFAVSDAMSIHAQKRRDQVFRFLLAFSILAILANLLYFGPLQKPSVLAISLILGLISYLIYKRGGSERLEAQYLDYRALAEACRVQYFWKRACIHSSVSDNFLLEQRDELEWIRRAVQSSEVQIDVRSSTLPCSWKSFENIKKNWIENQCKYFVGSIGSHGGAQGSSEKKYEQYSKYASRLFLSGMVITVTILPVHPYLISISKEEWVQWIGFIPGLFFGLSGVIKIYMEIKAFDEHSRNFKRGGLIMRRAIDRLRESIEKQQEERTKDILFETGCAALDENGDWLLLHRQRPVKVPH